MIGVYNNKTSSGRFSAIDDISLGKKWKGSGNVPFDDLSTGFRSTIECAHYHMQLVTQQLILLGGCKYNEQFH